MNYLNLYRGLLSAERWLVVLSLFKETVSSHMHIVALLAYDIAKSYNIDVDLKKLLFYAIVHDLDELYSGDIPANAKHKLKIDFSKEAIPFVESLLSKETVDDYKEMCANKDSLEYKLMKVADNLCVILKAKIEMQSGNVGYSKVLPLSYNALKRYADEPQLKQAVEDILQEYS